MSGSFFDSVTEFKICESGKNSLFVKWPEIGKFKDFKDNYRVFLDPEQEIRKAEEEKRRPIPPVRQLKAADCIACSSRAPRNSIEPCKCPCFPYVSVKLHGTNGAIGFDDQGQAWVQSRNHILGSQSDNCGFFTFAKSLIEKGVFKNLLNREMELNGCGRPANPKRVVFFGEWCGKGIQKNVALEKCPKHFAVFSILFDNQFYLPTFEHDKENFVYNAHDQKLPLNKTCTLPGTDVEEWGKISMELAQAIDQTCPWSQKFGVTGPGEGVVVQMCRMDGAMLDPRLWFKSKGEAHMGSKKAAQNQFTNVLDLSAEQSEIIREFLEIAMHPARCSQGYEASKQKAATIPKFVTDPSIQFQIFRSWMEVDIRKEEKRELDAMREKGIDFEKHVKPEIAKRCHQIYSRIVEK